MIVLSDRFDVRGTVDLLLYTIKLCASGKEKCLSNKPGSLYRGNAFFFAGQYQCRCSDIRAF